MTTLARFRTFVSSRISGSFAALAMKTQLVLVVGGGALLAGTALYEAWLHHVAEGALMALRPDAVASSPAHGTWRIAIGVAGALMCAGAALIASRLGRRVVHPLVRTTRALETIATGNLTPRLAFATKDEVGRMARAFDSSVTRIAGTFRTFSENSERLSRAANHLAELSVQMSATSEETAAQARNTVEGAARAGTAMISVGVATEQMTASIREIARSAADAAAVASRAAAIVNTMQSTVERLDRSSGEIGEMVGVITAVADQTNLLSVNAAIEAARAGEVGRGFAVVANEVKDLSRQTARSSVDIARKVGGIQSGIKEAVEGLNRIGAIVNEINILQASIASAVEEQAATTNEINRHVMTTTDTTREIAANIAGVAQAAGEATTGAHGVRSSADDLSLLAIRLRRLVEPFRL